METHISPEPSKEPFITWTERFHFGKERTEFLRGAVNSRGRWHIYCICVCLWDINYFKGVHFEQYQVLIMMISCLGKRQHPAANIFRNEQAISLVLSAQEY